MQPASMFCFPCLRLGWLRCLAEVAQCSATLPSFFPSAALSWLWLDRDFRTGKRFSVAVFRHLWSNVQAMCELAVQKPNTFLLQHNATVLQISVKGFVHQRPYGTVGCDPPGRRLPSTDPFIPRERARVS